MKPETAARWFSSIVLVIAGIELFSWALSLSLDVLHTMALAAGLSLFHSAQSLLSNRTHPQISSASKDVAGKITPPESLP